jgi:hypothetical protein
MLTLEGIQAVPTQTFRTPIDQGIIISKLYYKPAIQMWFIDVTFNEFIVNGLKISVQANILNQYKNNIPFGINVQLLDADKGYEPVLIDDFSSGRVTLNILDQTELEQIDSVYEELKDEVS